MVECFDMHMSKYKVSSNAHISYNDRDVINHLKPKEELFFLKKDVISYRDS